METNAATLTEIDEKVKSTPVLLFMKGTPMFPQCGFSARAVEAIAASGCTNFSHINVFERPDIRSMLPQYSDWPTFPQLFIQGELIGGCDIITALHESGELKTLLDIAA